MMGHMGAISGTLGYLFGHLACVYFDICEKIVPFWLIRSLTRSRLFCRGAREQEPLDLEVSP